MRRIIGKSDMEKNIELLKFLDGGLTHEEEAELLHRLSVSPERRGTLRNYIDQRALFQRDREAINVPYGAEQKLWTRFGELMPGAPAVTNPAVTARHGFRWITMLSTGAACIVVGLLSGFYLARNSTTASATSPASSQMTVNIEAPREQATNLTRERERITSRPEAPLARDQDVMDAGLAALPQFVTLPDKPASPASITPGQLRADRQENYQVLEPRQREYSLAELVEATQHGESEGSILHRMELNFAESFGKQFPEDATSRNTQPIITNSAISGLYQVFRGPVELWAGIGIGSANIVRKSLREALVSDGRSKIVADVSHAQTTWGGALVQGRHRLNESISVTASAGAFYSSLGPLLQGEIGGRYDLTDQVGVTIGIRSLSLYYDLTKEQNEVMNNRVYDGDLGGDRYGIEWSHNFEIATGMYFRF